MAGCAAGLDGGGQIRDFRLADGVVVGSALVDQIAKAASPQQAIDGVLGLCAQLAEGVRGARR